VAAIIDSIDTLVSVVGHSYGALCALEAALLTANMRRLVLYEGVPLRGAQLYKAGIVDRLERLLEAGDVEGVLVSMFRDVVEASPKDMEILRLQKDAWAARLRNAPTIPRELRAEQAYTFEPDRFRTMRTPTLLLVGGESPVREMENAEGVAAALPQARVAVLAGQEHVALYTAPEVFVSEVVRFLEG
jgi:pimeloyl-ACP methyl ester carboxylesterase